MALTHVLGHLENTIKRTAEEIGSRGAGGDKLDSLAKVVNSYRKLLEFDLMQKTGISLTGVGAEEFSEDRLLNGDPSYVEALHNIGSLPRRQRKSKK